MLTCNRYINLLVFYHLTYNWNNNTLDYIMSKYRLIFSRIPDKILISDIHPMFINDILEQYKNKWNYKSISDDEIKVLYFHYLMNDERYNKTWQLKLKNFNFSHFTSIYNKIYFSYHYISDSSMIGLLHKTLQMDIMEYLNNDIINEKFKFLYLNERLTKIKNNV